MHSSPSSRRGSRRRRNRMESLRWRRLEPPGRPGIERVRPVVRPVARTGSARQARVAIAAGAGVVALAAGLAISAGRPSGPSRTAAGDAAADTPALAAIAPDVAGRPWLVRRGDDRWVWGRTGARGRTVLPEDEMGLAIAGEWLASGVSTGAGTHVRIRDLATGAVILERDAGLRVAAATFAGGRLLLTGDANGGHDDGGVVAIDVPDGGLRTLVAPGAFPARLGAAPSKGDFHVSGGGSVAAVNTCGSKSCDTTVIDLATLATSTPQRGSAGFLPAAADEGPVGTGGGGGRVKGIDGPGGRAPLTPRHPPPDGTPA